ncbi:hypothetical protein V1L52_03470 [Treponema sp. HNW]|uniref:hypothetical protein n=1 Tax=Treponema sp. HNW TaxID=3116654 RepID=UPI003D0DFB9E
MKINSFYPVVMTKEVKACADFFIKYFDFNTTFEADWYISLIDENKNELAVLDYRHETVPKGFGLPLSGLLLNVEVNNVDEVYDILKKDLKDKIILDIKSETFGQRHFIIEGPSKILVDVIQVIPHSEEYRENYE